MMVLTTRPDRRAVLVVVAGTVLLCAVILEAPPWLRVPAAVLWTLVIPGLPWARRMRLRDAGDTAGVTLAISFAATALVGGAMASLHAWSPAVAVVLLAVFAAIGALLPRRTLRTTPAPRPEVTSS